MAFNEGEVENSISLIRTLTKKEPSVEALLLCGVCTNLLGSFKNSSILHMRSSKFGRAVGSNTQPVVMSV